MSRRRMMMQIIENDIDYFEGYRNNQLSGEYKLYAEWLNKDTVNLRHPVAHCNGPVGARLPFICEEENRPGAQVASYIMDGTAIPTLEDGKTYRFTATVTKVNSNTATPSADGGFYIGCGRNGKYAGWVDNYPISSITVGTSFEMEFTISSTVQVAVFYFGSNGEVIWDFDFKVKLEEV